MTGGLAGQAPATVLLFGYARADHLRRTVDALRANPLSTQTSLIVFCDAAKHSGQASAVEAVREVARSIDGFASVRHVFRARNLGLAASLIDGISTALVDAERVIVLEDDLVVAPSFLAFMNQGLELYENDDRVASIHGYTYPVDEALPETFFLRGADCWGWATWRSAWRHFEPDGRALLARLRAANLTRQFDLGGAYPYTRMLEDQIAGRNDSWAVRWHASCFLHDLLTLYPGQSLVRNIGGDDSGTHSGSTTDYDVELGEAPLPLGRIAIEESTVATRGVADFFRRKRALPRRIVNRLRRMAQPRVARHGPA